jgi:hypothetical protein
VGLTLAAALAEGGEAERLWLAARWRRFQSVLCSASRDWQIWATEQLQVDPTLLSIASDSGGSKERLTFDRVRDAAVADGYGQVFTPPLIADTMARLAGVGEREASWPSRLVLDPACGDGSLLLAVMNRRFALGWSVSECLMWVEGWDRDPIAAFLCTLALLEWGLHRSEGVSPPTVPLRVHGGLDSLQLEGPPGALLRREGDYALGVGLLISNPPYMEAKRMSRLDRGMRERLRRQFPKLTGAFDLYLAFCWRALEQVGVGGVISFLIPNKVLQGRYAAPFRRTVLEDGGFCVEHIADLSRMKPRPFKGRSVYPVIVQLAHEESELASVSRATCVKELSEATLGRQTIRRSSWRLVGGEHPLFVPRKTWSILEPLFQHGRLKEIARFASTCSFHRRGLREIFVTENAPAVHAYPYLGGRSHARRNEVRSFEQNWQGWWIRYDQEELKGAHKNPLPNLEKTFLRPKVIIAQHALRVSAFADFDGRFVTKDVYPVGWTLTEDWSLGALASVLNSTVFSALYNTIYHGVTVGGETYHYLPAFLHWVPVPPLNSELSVVLDELVCTAQSAGKAPGTWVTIDRLVAEAYGVCEADRERLVDAHLRRVGADFPGA